MSTVVWVSGASSGIGAAFAEAAPFGEGTRVINISRRPGAGSEHLPADLADPSAWSEVASHFRETLSGASITQAVFFHCSGVGEPVGFLTEVATDDYMRAVLLNAASGQVLGQAFLSACDEAGVNATLVLCSTPAVVMPMPGLTHYSSGKAGIELWVQGAAMEQEGAKRPAVVFAVRPWKVDTPMMHAMAEDARDDVPITVIVKDAVREGLASPSSVAAEIWAAIEGGIPNGSMLDVGAVPSPEPGVAGVPSDAGASGVG